MALSALVSAAVAVAEGVKAMREAWKRERQAQAQALEPAAAAAAEHLARLAAEARARSGAAGGRSPEQPTAPATNSPAAPEAEREPPSS